MARAWLATPLGALEISVDDRGSVTAVGWKEEPTLGGAESESAAVAARQLAEYFADCRRDFDLPLAPVGGDFEKRVWEVVRRVPFGATRSYRWVADELGKPGGSRAVGAANARNPIAIITPCHRIVGSDENLTGYAGGLWRKRWLLAHESGQLTLDL
jgi:methylated-DNA-[protein]-cysteine S-methyltransferase